MASSHRSDNSLINLVDIRNDFNIIFNNLINNIDKHQNKTINKELLKQWVNESKQLFSDQIKKRKQKQKCFVNKSSVSSTKMNEDLFTTDLSPIRNHFDDSQHHFDEIDHDLSDSQVLTNGQQINESLNDDLSEETIAIKSHINDNEIIDNIINNTNIEIDSDSIEIVENIDNNMDYMDFITNDNQINDSNDEDNEDNEEVSNEDINDNNSEVDNEIEDQFSEKEVNDHNYSVDNNEDNCDQKSDCNDNNSVDENDNYSQSDATQIEHKDNELINNENSVDIDEIEVEVSQTSDHEMVDESNCDTNAGNGQDSDEEQQIKTNLRPRKGSSNSDKSSSLSSDVEFDDLSDSPQSDSSSDDDEDYTIEKKIIKDSSQRISKYERVANDRRLQMTASVNLINLDNDLIEESFDDASNVCQNIVETEKRMFDSLRSKGFICRKIISKTKTRAKEDEDSDEKEFKQMLRIPKISNIAKKRKNRHSDIKNNDQINSSNDSEKSDCDKLPKNSRKKFKSEHTGESDNDLDLDSDDVTSRTILKRRDESPPKLSNYSKTVDILDSDVSSAEEEDNKDNDNDEKLKKKSTQRETKEKLKKSSNENSDKEVEKDNDCDHKNKNNIDKVLRKANALMKEQKKDSKSVIDIESDSEDEVVSKKRIIKRRVSDDSYCEKISDNEDSDSSVIESSGMDPSGPDTDSDSNLDLDSDSKTKSKNKKTSKRKVKTKSKGKRKRVVSIFLIFLK